MDIFFKKLLIVKERTFRARKIKKKNTLKKFHIFPEMELFSLKIKTSVFF